VTTKQRNAPDGPRHDAVNQASDESAPTAEPTPAPRCDCPALPVAHTHEPSGPEPLPEP
jgi:hypothetical protein